MRIGYLVPKFPSQTHIFFWREIRELRRSGEEVILLSTTRPPATASRHDFASLARAETHYLLPPRPRSICMWGLKGLPKLRSALMYLERLNILSIRERIRLYASFAAAVDLVQWSRYLRIDHIHCHSCANSAHIVALAKCLGGPSYSLTLHGDLAVYGRNQSEKMEKAEFVSVVGNHLRRQILEETDFPEQKIHLTCMGVATSDLEGLGKHREFEAGTLRLVTVARLHPNKGHLHALPAVAQAIQTGLNITYTIAGDGPHRDRILEKIKQLGLTNYVRLTGTLGESEVLQLLANSDAYLLPSIGAGEAWPVSVMEAMGAGLPVISTRIGATPEMINSGVDGILVPQADEEAILKSILLLGNNPELRRKIGDAARVTARSRFDVRVTTKSLISAINLSKSRPNEG